MGWQARGSTFVITFRNLGELRVCADNARMDLGQTFVQFLEQVAIGSGVILALFVLIRVATVPAFAVRRNGINGPR